MTETLSAIEDFTRLTLLRLRGELPVDDRPRLEALEDLLRDRIDGARPAPRKIENPTAVATARPSMNNVKPAQVTITRRGPGEGGAPPQPTISAAPAAAAPVPNTVPPPPAPRAAPPPASPRAAPPPPAAVRAAPIVAPPLPVGTPIVPIQPLGESVTLSATDRGKLNEISAKSLPKSGYTPSDKPLYMEDYYDEAIERDNTLGGNDRAGKVLSLGESMSSFTDEARLLFGVTDAPVEYAQPLLVPTAESTLDEGELTELRGDEETQGGVVAPPMRAPPARDGSNTASIPQPSVKSAPPEAMRPLPEVVRTRTTPQGPPPVRPMPEAQPARAVTPVIVQLIAGGTKRGELLTFEPENGVLRVKVTGAADEESIDVNEVFAIYVGHVRGVPPAVPTGTRIAVRMTNDKEVVGVSPDYAPGAGAMTMVPDDRRTVDRIWIPAWSVSEIRFA